MVESIGPNKIHSISKTKAVAKGRIEKQQGNPERRHKESAPEDEGKEEKRIGVNIDERC